MSKPLPQHSERVISDVCATIENRCGIVRGIGPAVREAVGPVLADRDRYREALEAIRDFDPKSPRIAASIAADALGAMDGCA